MDWEPRARALARAVTDQHSRWHLPLASVPRHLFVPRWWEGRRLVDGPADEERWAEAAYSDKTLVTAIGGVHADHAGPEDSPAGLPTSSSTLPGLVVRMYRHARLYDGAEVLDVGTGSGYGCALLASRFGDAAVTSIDVDPYLTKAAAERLAAIGLAPRLVTGDASEQLPGRFDRIVSMTSVPVVPGSWMEALRLGGRLVTALAGTMIIITAVKGDDGWATGQVEWDRAGFMAARSGPDYPPGDGGLLAEAEHGDGDQTGQGRYPVLDVRESWELRSVLEVTAPGISHRYREGEDGTRTALMTHSDGSWARAVATGDEAPVVHQGGAAPPVGHPRPPARGMASPRLLPALRRAGVHPPERRKDPPRTRQLESDHLPLAPPAALPGQPCGERAPGTGLKASSLTFGEAERSAGRADRPARTASL
jgi:protein-L-isoaspartate O-methyltransferase